METDRHVIILNHMFTGDYLNNNLGHEVINLFRDDKQQNNIYLCRDGKYSREDLPKYVIQVRRPHLSVRTLEVINIATELELFKGAQEEVTYGRIPVTTLFSGNKEQQEVCITFRAGLVIKPTAPLYICYQGKEELPSANTIVLKEKVVDTKGEMTYRFNVSQQLREYFSDGDDYNTMNEFCTKAFEDFSHDNGWEQVDEDFRDEKFDEKDFPLLPADIYGIGTWELAYSNAFKHFLESNKTFLKAFCELCLRNSPYKEERFIPLATDEKVVIKREWKHIDLLIEYDEYVFVIENKIFSDLNGKDKGQLDDYKTTIEKEEKYKNNKKIYILLTPNHNKIKVSEPWRLIPYKDVHVECIKIGTTSDEYFETFTRMIELHIEEDYNYGAMKRRFKRTLSLLQPITNN